MDRDEYARVSAVISRPEIYARIDPAILANKQRIGTNVHEAIEAHYSGIPLPLEIDEEGYFESWKKWSEENSYEPVFFEERFYDDELKVQGMPDCILSVEGKNVLVDWKTSASPQKDSWRVQGEFYRHLLKVNDIETIDEMWFVQLKKDGKKPKVHMLKGGLSVWSTCLAFLRVYNYWNRPSLLG